MATELSTDNSLQRYKKDLILPNYFDKFHNFCPFSTYKSHFQGTYCRLMNVLQIFFDAFHANDILTLYPTGVVIDNGFVQSVSLYIKDGVIA